MHSTIKDPSPQLHPLQRALKESWRRLVVVREIKQLYLAMQCKVDESRISRWLNPDEADFPPTLQMARLIEAMQSWPGVEPWEPLEAWNAYFGCHTAAMHQTHEPLRNLAALLSLKTGQAIQLMLQAMAPDSEGGVDVTDAEREALRPTVAAVRRIADQLDDLVDGKDDAPELERAQ